MNFAEYLQTKTKLPIETINLLEEMSELHEFPKGYKIVKEGSYSQKLFFIEKGIIRSYYYKDIKDVTHGFFYDMDLFASVDSVFLNKPSSFTFELLEDSVIRTVDYSRVEKLIETDPTLILFSQFVMGSIIKELSERLRSIQFQSAQERYDNLITNYPDILLRVSLGHIASYLGITQQTLSVIRAGK